MEDEFVEDNPLVVVNREYSWVYLDVGNVVYLEDPLVDK